MIHVDSYRITAPAESAGSHKYLAYKAEMNGTPPDTGLFTLFPSGKEVIIKKSSSTDDPGSRLIEVKGAASSDIFAGSILIPAHFGFTEGKSALIVWKGVPPQGGRMILEIRDLPHYEGCPVSFGKGGRVCRITAEKPFLQMPGRIYHVSGKGAQAECVLLMAEPFTQEQAKLITKRVHKFGNFPGPDSIYSMNLRVRGFLCLPEQLAGKEYEGALRKGNWLIMDRLCEKWQKLIQKRADSETGVKESDLRDLLEGPEALVRELISELIETRKISRHRGYLVNVSDSPEEFLSPMTRSFYDELVQSAEEGLNMKDALAKGRPDMPEILQRRGLARKLDQLLLAEESYVVLRDRILEMIPKDRPFDLSDFTGSGFLSRSRLLLFLDEMERDGLIKSSGKNKRVLA
jgi:hypothetical protein